MAVQSGALPRATTVFAVLMLARTAAAAPQTPSSGDLTPVQVVFVSHLRLTWLPVTPGASPDQTRRIDEATEPAVMNPPVAEFKPGKRSTVLLDGMKLMFFEHALRVATEADSRVELKGPFFKDWFASVHIPRHWSDGDPWRVNYIGHPINGSAAARIWLDQREPKAATTGQYLRSMGRALVFATIFSELFEIGPISEASIGNVSRLDARTGWTDHVVTPIGGVLWTMGEDAIDRWVLRRVDARVPFVIARAAARMILNPGRMLANLAQNRAPWYRDGRPISAGLAIGR